MADLIVDTYKLKQYAQRLSSVYSRIHSLDRRLDALYYETGLQDLWNLMRDNTLAGYSGRLNRCKSYLRDTAQDFESVESDLLDHDPTNFHFIHAVAHEIIHLGPGSAKPPFFDGLPKIITPGIIGIGVAETAVTASGWKMFWDGALTFTDRNSVWDKTSKDGESYIGVLNHIKSGSFGPTKGEYKDKSLLGDEDHFDINKKQDKKDGYQKNKDENWYDQKGTILEGKAEVKEKVSVVSGSASGKGEYAQGSAEFDVLTAEGHASASAGLYVYTKDENGNVKKMFSPGVSAEVGASVAVVQAKAEGRVGLGENNNMLGMYGNAEVKALSAEAEGKVAINRNEVYMGASAEADLVKVSATGGVAVLGTDVGVTGSLKIGVGAHAEVGVTDGKIKVDIGAAVGVGFDLGFEVDVSGTVDAVCDVATSAWDTVSDAWDGAKDQISDAWDGAKDAVSDAWDGAKDAVSDAWDGAKDAVSDAWDGAKDAVSDAWDWLF